jgi:hypothetical protein
MDGSWDENEREEADCRKYSKIRVIVDIDDRFTGRGARKIEKYWNCMEEYVLKMTENISIKYEFRVSWLGSETCGVYLLHPTVLYT